jgi:hypothetical protein
MQCVGQIMGHLRSEMRPYTRGGDLKDTVMLDQNYLPTRVIAHRDLMGADAMNVCAHSTPPFATQAPAIGEIPTSCLPSIERPLVPPNAHFINNPQPTFPVTQTPLDSAGGRAA